MDYIKKHRDSKTVFGSEPTILNLSVGVTRDIVFTDKQSLETRMPLENGSIIAMYGDSQNTHLHEIPRDPLQNDRRYSLTWREKIAK